MRMDINDATAFPSALPTVIKPMHSTTGDFGSQSFDVASHAFVIIEFCPQWMNNGCQFFRHNIHVQRLPSRRNRLVSRWVGHENCNYGALHDKGKTNANRFWLNKRKYLYSMIRQTSSKFAIRRHPSTPWKTSCRMLAGQLGLYWVSPVTT